MGSLAGNVLPATAMVVLAGMLTADARLSTGASPERRWHLAGIAASGCGADCGTQLALLVREELGSFGAEVGHAANPVAGEADDALALIDPSGQVVARFTAEAQPRRIATRIRVLLTGRFDPELTETCTPRAVSAAGEGASGPLEVRDRWQKGL